MFQQKLTSKNAPKAIGPYSPGIKIGDFIFLSGQVGFDPQTMQLRETLAEQTHQIMRNIKALLDEQKLDFKHIVKVNIFMQDLKDFDEMNKIYGEYLSEPYPARSCVQVAKLPLGALVEIECIVIDTLLYEQSIENTKCEHCEVLNNEK